MAEKLVSFYHFWEIFCIYWFIITIYWYWIL